MDSGDPESIARKTDASSFARLMEMRITRVDRGYALAVFTVSDKHTNMYGLTHGAALYSLADHACSVCGNSLGKKAMMIQSTMSFFKNPPPGTLVEAEARMVHEGGRTGCLNIDLRTAEGDYIARFQAMIYFTS